MRKLVCTPGSRVHCKINTKIINKKDDDMNNNYQLFGPTEPLSILTQSRKDLRVLDLFAGAGGMGLGFLMGGNQEHAFQIINVAEINPIYVRTLEKNYNYFFTKYQKNGLKHYCPSKFNPIDLTESSGYDALKKSIKRAGGVDVLIGGPPCQGFSQANRHSWGPDNHYNKLVDIFVDCVIDFAPKVVLMENVQGILWTPKATQGKEKKINVVDYIDKKLKSVGYILFPTVLDAAWYGVPQHRNRVFLLGLHKSLGYTADDFGDWGPFPLPTHGPSGQYNYVTVRDAISDLPVVENGESRLTQDYHEPTKKQLSLNTFLQHMREKAAKKQIKDHIVSKQADYVIDRYQQIPQGGNWKDIQKLMTNYSDISRTHSNIYRRLKWDEPSITISHYRKSMIIHPEQHRGLSLREASRLQSLPDWFTFCGTEDDSKIGGIGHKQQQLANAVSFLLTVAIAKYILTL